jgi:tetratricopeptide (TPR) repeat protein
MVEIDATRVANAAKMSAGELKSKVEFQALIVQFFLQRRFEHTILACRLYRNLYEDGDSELKLKEGSDVEKMFTRTTGTTPTVSALDALASEFIRDVDEGVVAFEYLADKGELESASKRLSEAFVIGEYLPRMRTLPRSQKEKALAFVRDSNQLISAIEVKDYSLAEEIVERLRKNSRDFDYSKPRAAIETARAASSLHIQNARSAAIKKDDKAVAEEIQKAALIWPTNPDLKAFATQVATYGDMNSRVLNDLDTLLAQKNYREIAREHVKYSGAVLGKPEYEQKLKAALEKVAPVDRVTALADEMVKAGDSAGAWERLEEAAKDYPDDNELNRRRAELAGRNAEFIHAINEARKHEDSGRTGVSLSWFLRAERLYPNSLMARKGIDRLADRILPESATASSTQDNPVYASPPTSTASDPATPPANPFPGESTQN